MSITDSTILNRAALKVEDDLTYLIDCLAEVLESCGDTNLVPFLPWRGDEEELPALPSGRGEEQLQLYSFCFQLLNAVEENVAMQARRWREDAEGLAAERGTWAWKLKRQRDRGVPDERIRKAIENCCVEPVLTAHPTEAKRTAVLELHRELYVLLFEREYGLWTASELGDIRESIKSVLERLWRSGELRVSKPTVKDELDNMLHYLVRVFPITLPHLDRRFIDAWHDAGFDGEAPLPQLSFGNWVGGDRDGHPGVTAEVTRYALRTLRTAALDLIHKSLAEAASSLTLSRRRQDAPNELLDALHELAAETDEVSIADDSDEPWADYCQLLARRVKAEREALKAGGTGGLNVEEIQAGLDLLDRSLKAISAERLSTRVVRPVRRLLDVFGLHLARTDIRQNSDFHDAALVQILEATGQPEAAQWMDWDFEQRLTALRGWLKAGAPFNAPREKLGKESRMVLDCLRVVAAHVRRYGVAGIGSLIVSMTRHAADLLVVYVLAREAGLQIGEGDEWVLPIPVVPLLETIDDLHAGPSILTAYMDIPVVQRSLAYRKQLSGSENLGQEIMVGYSDSNKDGGFLASNWHLRSSQRAIANRAKELGLDVVFFHGRGGTVSRGAGPADRFLESLPVGSVHGRMRMTEQGETIAQKYANQGTATFELEQLQAGLVAAHLRAKDYSDENPAIREVMDKVVEASRVAWTKLIAEPGFITYWAESTPIDALEQARIGSRPARRTGKRSVEDLRAIPWVFSWNQSRHVLTGWYGVGTALHQLKQDDKESYKSLQEAAKSWPFLRGCLINCETSLHTGSPEIMRSYAELVKDEATREHVLGLIFAERERTKEILEDLLGGPAITRRPRLMRALGLRGEPLVSLHHRQIDLLKTWRGLREQEESEAADKLLPELLMSVNAIASGMRTTG